MWLSSIHVNRDVSMKRSKAIGGFFSCHSMKNMYIIGDRLLDCSVRFRFLSFSVSSYSMFRRFSSICFAYRNEFPIQSKLLHGNYSQRLPTFCSVYGIAYRKTSCFYMQSREKRAPVPAFLSTVIDFPIAYPCLVIAHERCRMFDDKQTQPCTRIPTHSVRFFVS